jgi:hypothetical protein
VNLMKSQWLLVDGKDGPRNKTGLPVFELGIQLTSKLNSQESALLRVKKLGIHLVEDGK